MRAEPLVVERRLASLFRHWVSGDNWNNRSGYVPLSAPGRHLFTAPDWFGAHRVFDGDKVRRIPKSRRRPQLRSLVRNYGLRLLACQPTDLAALPDNRGAPTDFDCEQAARSSVPAPGNSAMRDHNLISADPQYYARNVYLLFLHHPWFPFRRIRHPAGCAGLIRRRIAQLDSDFERGAPHLANAPVDE